METGFCLVYSDDILHDFKDDIYQCHGDQRVDLHHRNNAELVFIAVPLQLLLYMMILTTE